MKRLKTGLSILIFTLLILFTLAFAAKNNQILALDFFLSEPVKLPVSLWLGLMLAIGALLGFASNIALYARQKMLIRKLKKDLAKGN